MVSAKKDLIKAYAEKFGVSKERAGETIDNVMEVMCEAITNGGVKLTGKFTIKVAKRKERDYKNPSTGEVIHKEAHNTLNIKTGSEMSKAINS